MNHISCLIAHLSVVLPCDVVGLEGTRLIMEEGALVAIDMLRFWCFSQPKARYAMNDCVYMCVCFKVVNRGFGLVSRVACVVRKS